MVSALVRGVEQHLDGFRIADVPEIGAASLWRSRLQPAPADRPSVMQADARDTASFVHYFRKTSGLDP
jgi:hypothetical protein